MIEAAIINKLSADSKLVDLLTTFEGAPAIFSDSAPEQAIKPFLIIRCVLPSNEYQVIQNFTVFADYYQYDGSRVDSREAAERIVFVLDQKILTSDRYSEIRMGAVGGSPVPDEDPRDVHYNSQFQGRAVRKKWIVETH